jgi:hypothetical protein
MKYKQTHGGKGSARRNANDKAYSDNWDKIFGNKDKPKEKPAVDEKEIDKS